VVFAIPGVGNLLVQSIGRRDFPVVTGTVMFIALVYVVVNLLVDVVYSALDPRVQYS
jgi:peptide/nickel transport system permease protein